MLIHSLLIAVVPQVLADGLQFGPSTFVAPGAFPTTAYKSYFNNPTATSAQVQPVITDPITNVVYPLSLTDPDTIPNNDTTDPHPLPPVASADQILNIAMTQIVSIANNPIFGDDTCTRCIAGLEVAKFVTLAHPSILADLATQLCLLDQFASSSTCKSEFSNLDIGSVVAQVLANADVGGLDGQMLCENFLGFCPLAPTSPLNLTGWFAKPKPNPLPPPRKPSGQRVKILHLSDLHLDPRYATGSEGNCTSNLCCRANNSPAQVMLPAPRFGTFLCDTPYALALAVLQSIPVLTNTTSTGFAWSLYTGDLVSHDPDNQLSRNYVEYAETVVYDLLKDFLNSGPVYAALGNHDSYNEAQDAPHSLGGALGTQFSWNYDHLSALWQHEQWLPSAAVQLARAHYAAYSVQRVDGLRIIALNTDFWNKANWFNYINLTTSDTSGMLRFLTDELQDAEDAGDRVWIIGHVLSGWDGTNALLNPTNLFYQIVDRFSPHVIANIFWGHTHEDEFSIFYTNNGTVQSTDTALAVSWVGPSVTPLTNLNSGFRVYEVDTGSFEVLDAHTWSTDVNAFPPLDHQIQNGPTFTYEYSTRTAFANITGWGPNDPLNATWWHRITEEFQANPALVQTFTMFQGKGSVLSPPCTSTDCVEAKICYMRSGSSSLAKQNCLPGFGSVQ
ncbi:Metallo-dependent phosphatase [Pluteus cervinus]|uniref:Metallo-dependent phosphatase n=1 Tax=Pluteus cervinus TaxID=181527 RepID=A0ACD3ATU9_9AGAR|nr:Metallo-dependent phosphatase [Pluteus cervinus]